MIFFKLTSDSKAKDRRELLGKELGIGYGNASQFITRLNNYGITREEFIEASTALLTAVISSLPSTTIISLIINPP